MRLTIYAENILLLHPFIARLSTETAAFIVACLFLDAFRCSLLLLIAVVFTVISLSVIRCGLPFAHFCYSRRRLAIQSFTSPSCRRCRLLSCFVVPSSASHSLTSSCRHHRRPATRLLQLLIANVDSLSSIESRRRAIKVATGQ